MIDYYGVYFGAIPNIVRNRIKQDGEVLSFLSMSNWHVIRQKTLN